jgi:hypothetical protein
MVAVRGSQPEGDPTVPSREGGLRGRGEGHEADEHRKKADDAAHARINTENAPKERSGTCGRRAAGRGARVLGEAPDDEGGEQE